MLRLEQPQHFALKENNFQITGEFRRSSFDDSIRVQAANEALLINLLSGQS